MRLSNKRFLAQKTVAALLSVPIFFFGVPAFAASKAIYRIDSVSVTVERAKLNIEAHGAARTGGWSDPRLVVKNATGPTIILELRANPPAPDNAEIQALMPVEASTTLRAPANVLSVQVISETNAVSEAVGR
jgi:hypothetical protein